MAIRMILLSVLSVAIVSFIWTTIKLTEIHDFELVGNRDMAFTPATQMQHDRYQPLQLASIALAVAGAGVLIYGVARKNRA